MLENYLKAAIRNIARHKGHSLINIVGLAIGIAGCLLISMWILETFSYDKFHDNVDDIYMVLIQGSVVKDNPATPFPLAEALEREVPEIQHASRHNGTSEALLSYSEKSFFEDGIVAVDPAFLDIFTYEFVEGEPATALDRPNSVVITEDIAEKYFGEKTAVGKVLTMNHRDELTVTGVLADPPGNTIFEFDFLVPFEVYLRDARKFAEPGWGWFNPFTFVKLQDGTQAAAVTEKISDFLQTHTPDEDALLSLLPFRDVTMFFSNTWTYVYMFSAIALFTLAIACINYVNLSTARSADRAMEIGMRKVNGAGRRNLVAQLLGESIALTFIALVLALALVELLLPVVNQNTGLDLSMDVIDLRYAVPALIALVVMVGVAAGAYPAFYLSSFQPVKVIAGRLKSGAGHSTLRRTLVVVQLSIAFFLIVGAQVVHRQLGFAIGSEFGYDKSNLVNIPLREGRGAIYEELKAGLLRSDKILGVTGIADDMPYFSWSTSSPVWDNKDPNADYNIYFNRVDYGFVETMGMELVEGRGFSKEFGTDATAGYVINEEMARVMGLSSAVGARLTMWDKPGTVIGVVKDFHHRPFTRRIGPLVLVLPEKSEDLLWMSARVQPGEAAAALQHIRDTWERIVPNYPFEYSFLEDQIERGYRQTRRLGRLSAGFSVLAVFIAALGMFGLASFTAERRTKEFAIRKVFGGSPKDIAFLLSSEFVLCLIIAFAIASPLAYLYMRKWLQSFVYRIDIGVEFFVIAAVLVSVTTLLAVSRQMIGAIRRNPTASLG